MKGIRFVILAGLMALVACGKEDETEEVGTACILTQMTTPYAIFDFDYDGEGRMTQVTDTENGEDRVATWTLGYEERNVVSMSSSQGVQVDFFYEDGKLSYFEWDEDGLPPAEYTALLSFNGNNLITMMQVPGSVYNMEWTGGNITRMTRRSEDGSFTVYTFTYDDKRSPYTNPAFLLSAFGDPRYLSKNNILTETVSFPESSGSLDGYVVTFSYAYNEAGFPEEVSWTNSLGGQSAAPTLFAYRCN